MGRRAIAGVILFTTLVLLIGSCHKAEKGLPTVAENRKLADHSSEFEKRIYPVADGGVDAIGHRIDPLFEFPGMVRQLPVFGDTRQPLLRLVAGTDQQH
jgi:hypothetical protein